ncbi:hypothetical protein HDV00_009107 [Rhizophlyctis rosea]|nr:hypothetical protein HDV00_009107 [Rhizophlyctis rosea]
MRDREHLTKDDIKLLLKYVGTPTNEAYYKQVSRWAWKKKGTKPAHFDQLQAILHDKVQEHPLSEDVFAFRYMREAEMVSQFAKGSGTIKRFQQGSKTKVDVYWRWNINRNVSASLSLQAAREAFDEKGKCLLLIYLPKGYPYVYLPAFVSRDNPHYFEYEILIASGTFVHIGDWIMGKKKCFVIAPYLRFSEWAGSSQHFGDFRTDCPDPLVETESGECAEECPPDTKLDETTRVCQHINKLLPSDVDKLEQLNALNDVDENDPLSKLVTENKRQTRGRSRAKKTRKKSQPKTTIGSKLLVKGSNSGRKQERIKSYCHWFMRGREDAHQAAETMCAWVWQALQDKTLTSSDITYKSRLGYVNHINVTFDEETGSYQRGKRAPKVLKKSKKGQKSIQNHLILLGKIAKEVEEVVQRANRWLMHNILSTPYPERENVVQQTLRDLHPPRDACVQMMDHLHILSEEMAAGMEQHCPGESFSESPAQGHSPVAQL